LKFICFFLQKTSPLLFRKMSFAVDLWDKFDFLTKKSNESRSRLDEFSSIIQQRADLEDYYSKIIEKIGLSLSNFIERGLFFLEKHDKN